jgi:hypothetical protein
VNSGASTDNIIENVRLFGVRRIWLWAPKPNKTRRNAAFGGIESREMSRGGKSPFVKRSNNATFPPWRQPPWPLVRPLHSGPNIQRLHYQSRQRHHVACPPRSPAADIPNARTAGTSSMATSKSVRSRGVPAALSTSTNGNGLRVARLAEEALHEGDNATPEFSRQPNKCNCDTAADNRIEQYVRECSHNRLRPGANRLTYNRRSVLKTAHDIGS